MHSILASCVNPNQTVINKTQIYLTERKQRPTRGQTNIDKTRLINLTITWD